ncbi:MAG: hypothetical protein QM791_11715 [Ferruginibacter sp.]
MSIFDSMYFLLLVSSLIVFLVSGNRRHLQMRLTAALLAVWLIASGTAVFLSAVAGWKNNLFIFHILVPVEYTLMMLLFRSDIRNKTAFRLVTWSIPAFIILSLFLSAFVQPPVTNNSYSTILESVLLICTSLYFLREVLLLQQVKELHRYPMFWITVGILFYYTGTLLTEGMLNYLISHSIETARKLYRLSYVIKYALFVLFIIGALCNTTKKSNTAWRARTTFL